MSSTTFDFLTPEVSQSDILTFCGDRVNLPSDKAKDYREKVNILRDHLERYISEHPEVGLAKMLLSGSLAKGTALRTLNDVDVAVYVKGDTAPEKLPDLLEWLKERLRTTYHQIDKSSIFVDGPCVVIQYSNLRVEVSPIYYFGDPEWRGYLWDKSTQEKILTSIPLHKDFVKKRKDGNAQYAQAVRLLKWWARQRDIDTDNFHLRSFLVELILAKLSDQGKLQDSYHKTLEAFFLYIQKSQLKERIAFTDNYALAELPPASNAEIEVFDPVNPQNNVASDSTRSQRVAIVSQAEIALDALSYAVSCQTKKEAVDCWKDIMGSTFTA